MLQSRTLRTTGAAIAISLAAFAGANVAQAAPGGGRGGELAALVQAGTITQAQARTVGETLREACQEAKAAAMDKALATLVSEGTITQAQADAVEADPRGLLDLVADGTITVQQLRAIRSELQEYQGTDVRSSVVNGLVADGTLTPAQGTAVLAALPAKGRRA